MDSDIDAFRMVIDYRRYLLTNSVAYIDPDAYLYPKMLKWEV